MEMKVRFLRGEIACPRTQVNPNAAWSQYSMDDSKIIDNIFGLGLTYIRNPKLKNQRV